MQRWNHRNQRGAIRLIWMVWIAVVVLVFVVWWGMGWLHLKAVRDAVPARPERLTQGELLVTRIDQAEAVAAEGKEAGLVELARLYQANGYAREARDCWDALAEIQGVVGSVPVPDFVELAAWCFDADRLANEAEQAAESGDQEDAGTWMERALELAPEDGALRYRAAVLWERLGRQVDALPEYDLAVQLDPQLVPAWMRLITLNKAIGETSKAFRQLGDALKANPDAAPLLLERGRAAAERGQLEKALADFQRVTALEPGVVIGYVEQARVRVGLDQLPAAVEALEQAWAIDAQHPVVLLMRAALAIRQADRPAAELWWGRVVASSKVAAQDKDRLAAGFTQTFGEAPPR